MTIVAQTSRSNDRPNVYVENVTTSISGNRRMGIVITGESGEEVNIWNCTGSELLGGGKVGWTTGDSEYTVCEVGGTARRMVSVGAYVTESTFTNLDGESYEVTSMTDIGNIAFFSSHGPTLDGRRKPDLVAPGGLTYSAFSQYVPGISSDYVKKVAGTDGRSFYYGWSAGTSMAAPVVTGTVALWLEACAWLTPEDVMSIVEATAKHDKFTETGGNDIENYYCPLNFR